MTDLERQIRTMIESATEGEKGALLVLLEAAVEAAVEARSTIDTLKVLLREAAPKCEKCGAIATYTWPWPGRYKCYKHRIETIAEPFELGRQIVKALEE